MSKIINMGFSLIFTGTAILWKGRSSTLATSKGLRVLKWSFIGMMVTAILQFIIVFMSGSVALLADTIHNFGDSATAIPLAIVFLMA